MRSDTEVNDLELLPKRVVAERTLKAFDQQVAALASGFAEMQIAMQGEPADRVRARRAMLKVILPQVRTMAVRLADQLYDCLVAENLDAEEAAQREFAPDLGKHPTDGEAAAEKVDPTDQALYNELSGAVSRSLSSCLHGQHEMFWIPFYEFCGMIGVEYEESDVEKLKLWRKIADAAGWWFPCHNVCFISERPTICQLDEARELHNDEGPALMFGDGWAVWQIHGNAVTEQIVLRPETLTVDEIIREQNLDVQSIMLERFGWPRFLEETGAELVDERDNEIEGTHEALYATQHNNGKRLIATCATGRVFSMGVPAETKTCEEAARYFQPRPVKIVART